MIIGILVMIMSTMRVHDDDKNWIKNAWSSRKWPTNPREPKDKYVVIPSRELTHPPKNGILKMIFLFPRWDMLIPWRVLIIICRFLCGKWETFFTFLCWTLQKNIAGIFTPSDQYLLLSPPHPQLSFSATNFFGACHVGGGYVIPSDDAQPARLDAVLATSRAFGNFRFKDPAQTPGDTATMAILGRFVAPGFLKYFSDMSMSWMLECSRACAIQRR